MSKLIVLAERFSTLAEKFAKENNKKKYIYHIKPKNFFGNYLYPLSELKNTNNKLYLKSIEKYKGREQDPEIKIKILNCKWKDCVNFSSIDPIKLFELEKLLGIKEEYKEVFKIPIENISDLNFCLYDDRISAKKDTAYKKITESTYKELKFIPPKTVKYYAESHENDELPLYFGFIPHILVNGKVPIDDAEIIKYNPN